MRTNEELQDTLECARDIFPEDIEIDINDTVKDWPFVYAGKWAYDAKFHSISRVTSNYEVANTYTCFAAGVTPQQMKEQRALICFLGEKPSDEQSLDNILKNMEGWSENDV